MQEHQQRYHWAYEGQTRLDPKLHLLTDGTWITAEQRLLVDQVLAPRGPKDDRPSAPASWPAHARNALMFSPAPMDKHTADSDEVGLVRRRQ